jgi:lipooligosaccharide transport system ATP-binding protein
MRRRLLIVRALVNEPELVVLDEPTTGLDPQARITVWELLGSLRSRGVTLLLTTHYMEEATRLCDRLVIMDRGRIVAGGTPAELTERYEQPDLEGVFLAIAGRSLDA